MGFGPPNREKKKTDDVLNSEELGTIDSTYRVPVPYRTGGFVKTVFLFVPFVRWGVFLALHGLCLLKYPFGEPPLEKLQTDKTLYAGFLFPFVCVITVYGMVPGTVHYTVRPGGCA